MKLREFKVIQMAKLIELKKQLLATYVNKTDRIEHIVNTLVTKLLNLRTYTLSDYIFTLFRAAKEFKEFEEMIPDRKTVERLLESEDE